MPTTLGDYDILGIHHVNVLTSSGGGTPTIVTTQLSLANGAAFKKDEKTITFEGDGKIAKVFVMQGLDVELKTDRFNSAQLATIFGSTAVTTGLPTDEAVRAYFGTDNDTSGVVCGIEVYAFAIKVSTGANVKVKVAAPRGILGSPDAPDFKSRDKAGIGMKFSAYQTLTNVIGTALPSVPGSSGAFWYVSEEV